MEGYDCMKVVVPILGLQRLREILEKMKLYKNFNNNSIKFPNDKDNIVDINNVDFSRTTVVLGKTGNISSEIVDLVSIKLQELGVNTYVSDIDHLMLSISEQAIMENPSSDIIIIRVDGVSPRVINPTVVVGCETDKYDSLGLAFSSSIGIDKTNVEKGKMISGINIPTELENEFCKKNFQNRVSTVTIIPEVEVDTEELANNIINAIVKFTMFSEVEKDRKYYDFLNQKRNWKKLEESKTGISTNMAIYPVGCYANIIKTNGKKM